MTEEDGGEGSPKGKKTHEGPQEGAEAEREQEGTKGSPEREVTNSETVWTANARRRLTTRRRMEGKTP